MRRIFGSAAALAALALALGCGRKDAPGAPLVALGENTGATGAPGGSIEGNWALVSMEYRGAKDEQAGKGADTKIRATANQLIATKNGKDDPLNYKLNPSKSPQEIDLTGPNGKGDTMYGIYKLEGDQLVICAVESTKHTDRPTEFRTTAANGAMMMTLKRD